MLECVKHSNHLLNRNIKKYLIYPQYNVRIFIYCSYAQNHPLAFVIGL